MRRRDNGEIDDTLVEEKNICCGKYMRNIFHIRHRIDQNRTEQNRAEQNRIEQNRIEQNRIEQNRTELNRIEQKRIEQNGNRKNRKEKKEQNGKDSKEFSRKQDIKSRTLTELDRCLSQNVVELDSIK